MSSSSTDQCGASKVGRSSYRVRRGLATCSHRSGRCRFPSRRPPPRSTRLHRSFVQFARRTLRKIILPRDTPGEFLSLIPDRLEDAGHAERHEVSPVDPPHGAVTTRLSDRALSMARSVAVEARTHATARRMTVSRHSLSTSSRPTTSTGTGGRAGRRPPQEPSGASAGPQQRRPDADSAGLTLARSVYLTGRVYAAGAGMTFSGYIEELIRRELDRPVVRPCPALEKTA